MRCCPNTSNELKAREEKEKGITARFLEVGGAIEGLKLISSPP